MIEEWICANVGGWPLYDNNNIPCSAICPKCEKEVRVIPFGYGHMAVCDDCHKIIYTGRKVSTAAEEK